MVTEPAATTALEPGARRALGSFLDGLRGRNASPGTVTGLKAEVGTGVTNGEAICEIKDAE